MNRDQIIRLAIHCGIGDADISEKGLFCVSDYGDITDEVIKFVNLIIQLEREACAKIAEHWEGGDDTNPAALIASYIRARE